MDEDKENKAAQRRDLLATARMSKIGAIALFYTYDLVPKESLIIYAKVLGDELTLRMEDPPDWGGFDRSEELLQLEQMKRVADEYIAGMVPAAEGYAGLCNARDSLARHQETIMCRAPKLRVN